jgi:hypothetical protein
MDTRLQYLIVSTGHNRVLSSTAIAGGPIQISQAMTLKIERSEKRPFTIFTVSGSLEAELIHELERLFGAPTGYGKIILDLKELRLADRETVRFLSHCEVAGLKIENCPAYIREWMKRERDE